MWTEVQNTNVQTELERLITRALLRLERTMNLFGGRGGMGEGGMGGREGGEGGWREGRGGRGGRREGGKGGM